MTVSVINCVALGDWMIVSNKFKRVYKVMVNLPSWNLPGKNEEKHGGPEGSLCSARDSN
jgi:hypothetical protein